MYGPSLRWVVQAYSEDSTDYRVHLFPEGAGLLKKNAFKFVGYCLQIFLVAQLSKSPMPLARSIILSMNNVVAS